MNILAIGNSFSQDATRYLHQIAKCDGCDMTVVNLYIGGCSLYTHFVNIKKDAKVYSMEFNGQSTGFFVSIKEALLSREWDYVTLQQVSSKSTRYETYQPYLTELSEYVRKYAPKAKQVIHQTWAYEQDSDLLCKSQGYKRHEDMFKDVEEAYNNALSDIKADRIIKSGELFQKMLENGVKKIHRDTFHATFGLGRYAIGLLWYRILTGNGVINNCFYDFDEGVTDKEIVIAKRCVSEL